MSACPHCPIDNVQFSDRNRIAADSRVSNRIEINRKKMTSIPDILKSMNSDTCRPCDDQGRSSKTTVQYRQSPRSRRPTFDAVNALQLTVGMMTPQLRLASSGRGSKLRRYKLSIVHGVKRRCFKPLISCRCWRGSRKHAPPT